MIGTAIRTKGEGRTTDSHLNLTVTLEEADRRDHIGKVSAAIIATAKRGRPPGPPEEAKTPYAGKPIGSHQ